MSNKPIRQKKPKRSARERGYVTRADGAAFLRQFADEIEQGKPSDRWAELVKVHVNVWYAKDDGIKTPHPQCSVCEGEPHHWRPNSISPEDTDERLRFIEYHGFEPSEELLLAHDSCAHCNAVRPYECEEDE